MGTHTPGPWTKQTIETRRHGYDWETFAVRSPQNVCIASVGDVDRYHAKDNANNASLIAAAPDLLAACEAAIRIVGKVVADDLMPDIVRPSYTTETLKRLETAIAKAKGV